MRRPKDLTRYVPSFVAAARLINLVIDVILCRPKALFRWELKVWVYYSPEALAASKAVCVPARGTWTSGTYNEPAPDSPPQPKAKAKHA